MNICYMVNHLKRKQGLLEYRVRPQDGPQEMERNEAAAKHVPGGCFVSFHFLWAILWPQPAFVHQVKI